jgi:hypothetical protein
MDHEMKAVKTIIGIIARAEGWLNMAAIESKTAALLHLALPDSVARIAHQQPHVKKVKAPLWDTALGA